MRRIIIIVFVLLAVLATALYFSADFILEVLWLDSIGIARSMVTVIFARWLAIPLFAFAMALLSLFHIFTSSKAEITNPRYMWAKTVTIFIAVLIAEIFLKITYTSIETVLAGYTGEIDPLTKLDFSFYLFVLPLIEKISIMIIVYLLTMILFRYSYEPRRAMNFFDRWLVSFILLSAFVLVSILVYKYIHEKTETYIGFMDIYGVFLPIVCTFVLVWVYVTAAMFIRHAKTNAVLFFIFLLLGVLLNTITPPVVHRVFYRPNESGIQEKFAGIHADVTRKSFNLNNLHYSTLNLVTDHNAAFVLSNTFWQDEHHFVKEISEHQTVLPVFNIKDAYPILIPSADGSSDPYLIAPRESTEGKDEIWDVKHFRNIFGYGAVIGYANLFTAAGYSELAVHGLSPTNEKIIIKDPYVFFSENYDEIAVVNTKMLIPDFEKSDIPTHAMKFPGVQGIKLTRFARFILSLVKFDHRFLFSSYYEDDSLLLLHRKPSRIAKALLPQFHYSEPVMQYIKGELWWEMDGYVGSKFMRMSESAETAFGNYNWFKAPIKVFVSAYSGKTVVDVIEPRNPYVKVAKALYPGVFKDTINMDIQKYHYPKELFAVQSRLLETYHHTNVASLYSGLQKLQLCETNYRAYKMMVSANRISLQSLYTPEGKNTLAAELIGYIDHQKRPKLAMHRIDPMSDIPAPSLAEAYLSRNEEFNRSTTLWDNLHSAYSSTEMTYLPMQDDGLYAEAVFIEPEQRPTPVLGQAIVIDRETVKMGHTINQLIYSVAGEVEEAGSVLSQEEEYKNVLMKAYDYFLQAEQARIHNNSQEYQQNVDKVGEALQGVSQKY